MTQKMAGSETHARITLEQLHIQQPCNADWSSMTTVDGEQVKFCSHCSKNVFNLSAMPRESAECFVDEQLARSGDAGLCVRLYKTSDGSAVSTEQPVRWCAAAARLAAVCSLLLAAFGCERQNDSAFTPNDQRPQLQAFTGAISPAVAQRSAAR